MPLLLLVLLIFFVMNRVHPLFVHTMDGHFGAVRTDTLEFILMDPNSLSPTQKRTAITLPLRLELFKVQNYSIKTEMKTQQTRSKQLSWLCFFK